MRIDLRCRCRYQKGVSDLWPTSGDHNRRDASGTTVDSSRFLHGFCTLEDNTEVCYKATSYYNPTRDAGVIWNDPDLGIQWPIDEEAIVLSEKDRTLPRSRQLPNPF